MFKISDVIQHVDVCFQVVIPCSYLSYKAVLQIFLTCFLILTIIVNICVSFAVWVKVFPNQGIARFKTKKVLFLKSFKLSINFRNYKWILKSFITLYQEIAKGLDPDVVSLPTSLRTPSNVRATAVCRISVITPILQKEQELTPEWPCHGYLASGSLSFLCSLFLMQTVK